MRLRETEAIILRTYKLAEADKIAVCLTREAGLIRGVAKGARRLKSKFGAALEPYSHVNLSLYENETRELFSIRQADLLHSYFSLAGNSLAVSSLEYVSTLVLEFAPPHEPSEKLFRLLKACIHAIAAVPTESQHIIAYFDIWMLKISGLLPDPGNCSKCRQPLPKSGTAAVITEGAFVCLKCAGDGGPGLMADTLHNIAKALQSPPIEWSGGQSLAPVEVQRATAQAVRILMAKALDSFHIKRAIPQPAEFSQR